MQEQLLEKLKVSAVARGQAALALEAARAEAFAVNDALYHAEAVLREANQVYFADVQAYSDAVAPEAR